MATDTVLAIRDQMAQFRVRMAWEDKLSQVIGTAHVLSDGGDYMAEDEHTLRVKYTRRKNRGDLAKPGFALYVTYLPGEDLYSVRLEQFDGSGRILWSHSSTPVYADALVDPGCFLTGFPNRRG